MSRKRNLIIVGALFALIVLYRVTPLSQALNSVRRPLATVGAPLFQGSGKATQWASSLLHSYGLLQDSIKKEQKIAELTYALESARIFPTESIEELERITIGAKVIAINSIGGTRMLLINRGSNTGVTKGSSAATPHGVFVGKVVQVFDRFSLLLPATAQTSATAAQVGRDPRIQAVVRGERGMGLTMQLISQDAAVQEADIIVTSLLEDNTPVGLLIGTVTSVSYSEGELFKEATLAPFISLTEISDIRIYIPKGE
ncbi:hypothetical protein BK004_03340 [bacterium CG10_46_32]|nr:MAG: hypothetical protein BK004_03340 [bacterium CG10_46_32]